MNQPPIHRDVEALIDNLRAQADAMREVTSTLAEQRGALAAMRGAELEGAEHALEEPSTRIRALEAERRVLHARIADALESDVRTLRFRRLARQLPEPLRSRFVDAAERARRAAEALRREASVGERLLDWSAACHEQLLLQLVASRAPAPHYGPDGQAEHNPDSFLIDTTR